MKIIDEWWNDNILVGLIIKVKLGDIFCVNLINELMDKINLYIYGFYISFKDNDDGLFSSDNVLLEINNSEIQGYEYVIFENYYLGIFWYYLYVYGIIVI